MKTKPPVSTEKQTVTLKDLPTKKNPKGGSLLNTSRSNKRGYRGIATTLSGGGTADT